MPGIAGLIRKTGHDTEANRCLLAEMCRRLDHTPGYAVETVVRPWFGLAFVGLPRPGESRLADQPSNCSGYSGYIYGWKDTVAEIGHSSLDIPTQLVHGFRRFGADLPSHIDGSFNLAIFDNESEGALLAADRMGHRHLYYADLESVFLFATELQAFMACPEFSRELDQRSIEDFFNIGYPLGDRTIFQQAKFLRGGHRLEYRRGSVKRSQWWDFNFDRESTASIPELIDEADAAYTGVIAKRVAGYDHVILPLSGGLDSRFIAGYALEAGVRPQCFTHGIPDCQDLRIARKLASVLQIEDHRFIEIQPRWLFDNLGDFARYAEGMVDLSPAVLLGISAQYSLPPTTTCFLNGIFGGPTNFGSGYYREEDIDAPLSYEQRIENIKRSIRAQHDMTSYYTLFSPEWRNRLGTAFTTNVAAEFEHHRHITERFHFQKDIFFIRNRLTRYMNRVDCNRYRRHDHFALADDRLLDFYQRLPTPLKVKRRFMIEYIKTRFPHLAAVEYQATGVNLYSSPPGDPLGLKQRYRQAMYYLERLSRGRYRFYDKRNYSHPNQWYRVERRLRELYESILTDKRTAERGYYDPAAVAHALKRQRLGGNSYYELTWLFSFECFQRMFVDSDAPLA